MKFNLCLLYNKTKRISKTEELFKEILKNIKIQNYLRDGYLAYSAVEKIFYSLGKHYFNQHKYNESLIYCK